MKSNLSKEQRRIARFENLEYGHKWELWRDGSLWYALGQDAVPNWQLAVGCFSIRQATKDAKSKKFIRVKDDA